jgi:pimeloyl-ACP methyl ester carboxylesterase
VTKILHSKIVGSGKPLLILHGFLGSGDNWISLGRKFAEYYEVHLVDLRNHGRSFHDDEMNFEVMTEDIINYCTHYKLDNVNIIGHSMGGKLAMFLAMEYPELLAKIVVADIAPKAYGRGHDFILDALELVDFSIYTTRNAVGAVLQEQINNTAIVNFLLKNVYRKTKDSLAFRFNLPVFVEQYGTIIESLPAYSEFDGAVLFLRGENSHYILDADIPLIKAHFPRAIVKEISHAGHWLHAENPVDFYKECLSFFEG